MDRATVAYYRVCTARQGRSGLISATPPMAVSLIDGTGSARTAARDLGGTPLLQVTSFIVVTDLLLLTRRTD
jgi:hypothetical protein